MPIVLSINTAEPMSDVEKNILRALIGESTPEPPAKRGPGRPRKTAEPKPDVEIPVEEPTVSEPVDLKATAVQRATELVSQKQADVVREALAKAGDFTRVGQLTKDADIEKFLAALP